ncbi:MAG: hypothetical protein MAG453_01851 [Calditrichaeota bacterium]|nr:hypothetical protein [Calditrichota bacterium]
MNADRVHALRVLAVIAAAAGMIATAGCTGDDDGGTGPDGLAVTRTLLVEHGRLPVWVDEESFLFTYAVETGDDGLYLSDLEGASTELYSGVNNNDHQPAPGGERVAFSTPELDGGVRIVNLTTNPPTSMMLYEGGRAPSWLDHDTVVLENGLGQFGVVDLANPGVFNEYGDGNFPVGDGSGQRIAFLFNPPQSSGMDLRWIDAGTMEINQLTSLVGTDAVWNPSEPVLYVSRLTDGTLSDVIEVGTSQANDVTVLLSGATRPSVSADGVHLFADRLETGLRSGIHYYNLQTSRHEVITGAARPAAAPSGTRLLAEQSDGIYLLEFE